MNKREIDDAAFVRAFGAQPRSGLDLAKWEKLRFAVVTYLAELPEQEPERDRIAVVVDRDGEFSCWNVDEEDVDNPEMWESLEEDAKRRADAHPPFARAVIRCNLPRPAQPIEVDGTVEEVG